MGARTIGAIALTAACAAPPAGVARLEPLDGAQLAPYAARVEAARGLRFARPARAARVPQAGLRALLERELDAFATRAELAEDAALAASLGLTPPDFEPRAALLAFQEANVAGFYSPRADRLYVVAGAASAGAPGDDALLVHELTHALQAQHGRAAAALLGLRGDDDLAFALSALLEGEATLVELGDAATRRGAARIAPAAFAAQFPRAEAISELPRTVAAPLVAAYPLGYALVDGLVARGGWKALSAATEQPPLTSETLLHPRAYLAGRQAALLELERAPALPGCRVRATNSYGEIVVRSWLEELGEERPAEAAAGWDADRAWRFACGRRTPSAWLLAYADAAEASALEQAMRAAQPAANGAPIQIERRGARVLLSAGLLPAERAALLALPAPRVLGDLAAYLGAHPEVERRARRARP
jgi:hypothetical protein